MKRKHPITTLSLALTAATRRVQLLPAGPRFRAQDGRPAEVADGWLINREIAERLIARCAARQSQSSFDFEHQTYLAESNGQPAPAAGWFSQLEWVDGEGLFAIDVEWTARAKTMIDAGEYRYVSPVIQYDRNTGAIRGLGVPALTNNPALDGMQPVTALAAAFAVDFDEEEPSMKLLELLRAALGLPADADESAVQAALTQLLGTHATFAALTTALTTERDTKIAALTAGQYDPARFVPLETVQQANAQIAELTRKLEGLERQQLLTAALSDGRLLPHMQGWADSLSLAALTSYLKDAQPLAVLSGTQTGGRAPDAKPGDMDDDALAVCRMFGNDPATVKKTLEAQP